MYKEDARLPAVNEDTVLWKYMNFTSFYRMLLTSALFFRRLDSYTDALEGTLPDQTREALYRYRSQRMGKQKGDIEQWINENIESYKAFTLANAWSVNDAESYAMWKIYLHGHNEGIAIKTTVKNFKYALDQNPDFDIYSGKVNYQPLDEKDINLFAVACNKRETYSYENEYRALIFNQYIVQDNNYKVPKFEIGVDVKVDLDKLINEVLVSPFSETWFGEVVTSSLQQLLPSFDLDKITGSVIRDQ